MTEKKKKKKKNNNNNNNEWEKGPVMTEDYLASQSLYVVNWG